MSHTLLDHGPDDPFDEFDYERLRLESTYEEQNPTDLLLETTALVIREMELIAIRREASEASWDPGAISDQPRKPTVLDFSLTRIIRGLSGIRAEVIDRLKGKVPRKEIEEFFKMFLKSIKRLRLRLKKR